MSSNLSPHIVEVMVRQPAKPPYFSPMRALACLALAALVSGSAPAVAQDFQRQRELNALRDSARAQERQADELRRLRQIEADRARREENDRVNAKRDARSMRRFDRP